MAATEQLASSTVDELLVNASLWDVETESVAASSELFGEFFASNDYPQTYWDAIRVVGAAWALIEVAICCPRRASLGLLAAGWCESDRPKICCVD